ncbi:16S rRNA (guanine(966)-N(2))-methyltransferase RsmD [Natranaerobius thermophilus]|uniref:Methyltransferase n=1 Tax=Natranaerobius thermophilus (strain ATCC BAA-1301 / DSM 18059 / JW/NM-WN-LF) TaxID=457570 RepID=B2A2L6_NATTJ|nr:16S rRNA (guanine(966)-N(2))-methyltransferase RsmD [Natranaerobius thermophilus]ACB84931.1 methyltransferase [Natranaerobius thermophilus JW/NM-WN-LF]
MRIIAGSKKGLKLHSLKSNKIRPTSDKVKESIFNMLQDITDTHVLDMFCGSGNLGLESLSRGARDVTFIDNNISAIKLVRNNVKLCEFSSQVEIIKDDIFKWLSKGVQAKNTAFDLVFADPPYRQGYTDKLLSSEELAAIISHGGLLILEHEQGKLIETELKLWKQVKEKNYGDTTITILTPLRSE